MNLILSLILATIASTLTIVFIKEYINKKDTIYLLLTILSEALLIYSYLNIFNIKDVSNYYSYIKIMSILLVSFYGFLLLNEPITNNKILGLTFGLLSIYFLC
jgi:uncharacterized membrane protein